ncbi:aspartyl protease family protein At5g10770-like [Hibiscus syriacus]|uniref:aspartyl protease family protein At5g10770-like n=1 Tax=Hibiscus syriacus TaxID=106335 RepID=UPI001923A7D1|nr:aspartyl protease family protein At5g10770-like [Hibiscus syriacus]
MEGSATVESHRPQYHHTHAIHVASLLLSSVCSSDASAQASDKNSLSVVHKHGQCSQLHREEANIPTQAEILLQDEARVKYIHSKLAKNLGLTNVKKTANVNLPAKDDSLVGNYIVTIGLGTPKKDLSLIFDTGSDITWTQCKPCMRSCYKQKDPSFSPSLSTTYSNVSCGSTTCNSLIYATGNSFNCSSSACVYDIQYGDSSVGFFAKEKLTLTSRDVFNNFLFGCGQNNQDPFGGAPGLLGLGGDKLSLPSQTAVKYKKIFSYCLPSSRAQPVSLDLATITSQIL